jgi:anti-sigma regulatory factor (Ser/Thr protein kinase)
MDERTVSPQARSLHFKIRRQSDVTLAVVACQREDFLPAFPADERGIVGTVVSELATNILKYAGDGEVLLESLDADGRHGVSIQVSDQGPGIKNLEQALADGFSTSGTLGLGLPAVKRMSDSLTITAPIGGGTVIHVVRWCRHPVGPAKPSQPPATRGADGRKPAAESRIKPTLALDISMQHRAYPGQTVCGDQTLVVELKSLTLLVQVDGTGHGLAANQAATALVACIQTHVQDWHEPTAETLLPSLLEACQTTASSGIGAAIGLVLVDREQHRLHYLGIGNTRIMVFKPGGWEGISQVGMLGHRYRKPLLNSTSLQTGDSVVTFSDGISSTGVRALRKRSDRPTTATAIADQLMMLAKASDDASCLVATCLI